MEKNNNSGVVHPEVKQVVVNAIYFIRNLINSFGLLVGSITLSIIDVALGGVVLGQLFSDYQFEILGSIVSGTWIGWGLSIVFWYIQLLLWDFVFKDGKITKEDVPAILIALIIALIDTFGDSSSVLLATTNSTLETFLSGQEMFNVPLFDLLVDMLFVAVLIVTGLNEFFNKMISNDADIDFWGSNHRKKVIQSNKNKSYPRSKKPTYTKLGGFNNSPKKPTKKR